MRRTVDKRRLCGVLQALLVLTAFLPAAQNGAATSGERRLSFFHTHTGEDIDIVYARDGAYVTPALDRINEFLADFRTDDVATIDPLLLDILFDLRESLGSDGTFEVISAYRSPVTNEMLRSQGTGVAQDSQHLRGKAIDVRLRGTATSRLRDAALALERGGVGYYPDSDFVHIDTGRVRSW